MAEKLIGLEDLPENFKVELKEEFRLKLFNKAVKKSMGFIKLAKILKIDWSSLTKIRRGYRLLKNRKSKAYMRIQLLKKLLKLTKTKTKVAEKNIIGLSTNKMEIYPKIPIFASKELASIMGNTLGDGYVSTQRFKYVNKRKELVMNVRKNIKKVFGIVGREFYIKEKKCYGIEFPGIVGQLLIILGAPNGRKTAQEIKIPEWIKNGDLGLKINFLKSLFDDDGSVCLGKFQDFITISFYKNKFLVSNLINFLNEVKGVLKEIGVNTSKVSYKKTYKNTQEYCFRIYGFKNLKIFYEKIGFNDSIKYQKLFIALKNYIIN